MPPKLPPCRVCSKQNGGQYKCPIDGAEYCSVVCFKQHKATGCSKSTSYEPAPATVLEVTKKENADDDRPRKKLKDLRWPPEPDAGLWSDPLAAEDLKPLRTFEYEAIATAQPLRQALGSPALLSTLERLSALPRPAREPSLRLLLGLPTRAQETTYRGSSDPFSTASRPVPLVPSTMGSAGGGGAMRGGRGGARGRGGRGRGGTLGVVQREFKLLESTPEERAEVERFVDLVKETLDGARIEKSGASRAPQSL